MGLPSFGFLKKVSGGDLLSHGSNRSTIDAGGLNGRVRHGTGCVPSAMTTGNQFWHPMIACQRKQRTSEEKVIGSQGLGVLVPVSSTPLRAYTPGLSIPSSTGRLT